MAASVRIQIPLARRHSSRVLCAAEITMKLTVKLPDGCPIDAKCGRRTLGVFQLVEHGTEPLNAFELPETVVALGSESTLVVKAHYTPANDVFSVTVRHRTVQEDSYLLAVGAECHCIPVGLVCRLLTGQYVEICLQHEKGAA